MKHLKHVLLFAALTLASISASAQTDVTNLYITNADLSSSEGWVVYKSTDYSDIGNGLIGTYNVRFSAATIDETHLATEYCFGFECRWNGNFSSYNQTTADLPAGIYVFTFDVENVNGSTTSAAYDNLCYVQVGETKYSDTATEWMRGKSSWTTHTISFTIDEAAPATFSLGYGTGSNNIGANNTPAIYVSHLKLTYQSLLDGLKTQWEEAHTAAETAINSQEYAAVTGEERTTLEAEIAKIEPTTQEGYKAAITALTEATNAFIAAKDAYVAFNTASSCEYPILEYAAAAKRTALDEACNVTPTSAEEAREMTAAITNALRAYYESNGNAEGIEGSKDYSTYIKNPDAEDGNNDWSWTGSKNNPVSSEPWTDSNGNSTHTYFDGGNWGANSWTTTMQQDITLPPGKYLLSAMGRAAANTTFTMSVGEASVELPHVGNTGNVFDNGWGNAVLEFVSDGLAASTILISASSSTVHEWFSISHFRLTQIKAGVLSDEAIAALIATIPEGKMNADVKATMDAAKTTLETEKTVEAYNALAEAIAAAEASIQAYTTIKSYIDYALSLSKTEADFSAINDAYNNGTYADDTEAAVIYEAYQSAEIAALVASNAEDFTSIIINPSFETGNMTGWSAESRYDTGVKANSNPTYTTTNVDGDYLFNSWGGSAENNVYQTIKNIPAGTYQLSAILAGFTGESLVLAANETTNAIVVESDKTIGNTVNIIFTLTEATDVTFKASNIKSQSGSDASFIKADNFTLKAYSDPLAALKEQLATLQEEASTVLADEAYTNVTGSEKAELEQLAVIKPEETEDAYNTAISDITAALSTFKNAKTNYDIFANYNIDLAYADADKKPVITNESTAISIITELRSYYESNAKAEGVEGAIDMTGQITNPTNPTNTTGWTFTAGNIRIISGEPYTNADGTTATGYFDSNSWGTAFSTKFIQDVKLDAGKYILTAKARGNGTTTYQVIAGEQSTDINTIGNTGGVFGRGWNDFTVEFEVTEDETSANIGINVETGSNSNWISFSDFRLFQISKTEVIMADADDYAALAAAIETAESHSLGFDAEEYAPYENVEAITVLVAAKAIDPTTENRKKVVNEATNALTASTWTANSAEVNCIYDGQFANTEANTTSGDINLPGWRKVEGIRMLVKDETTNPGLIYTDGKAALFSWGGTTLTYGEQTGYTLPMNVGERYQFTLKITGWRDGDLPATLSVTLGEETKTLNTNVSGRINNAEGNPFSELEFIFTPTTDNPVLKIYADKHFAIADLLLMKAPALVGDVNGDDNVNVADVTALVNILLSTGEKPAAANVDGNDTIDADDVKALINIILEKE